MSKRYKVIWDRASKDSYKHCDGGLRSTTVHVDGHPKRPRKRGRR